MGVLSMRTEVVSIVTAVLVPVVTATVGALGLLFQDWRQRRSQVGRRKLAFEDATRQVAFASDWWKARQSVVSSPQALQDATTRALAWLDEASALVTAAERLPVDGESRVSLPRLLLFYRLQGRSAKIIRVAYYLCLGAMVYQSLLILSDALEGSSFKDVIVWETIWAILLGTVALSLRFWAVSAEGANSRNQGQAR